MDPPSTSPPPSGATAPSATALSAPPHPPYTDSLDSSPRSRTTDTWEGGAGETLPPVPGGSKLRLMCSYGGHIIPRPHDKSLCYVGGETRIVVVDRNSTLPELLHRLSKILLSGRPFTLKYQLPNEDLDSLITVSSEEDLENMIDEYDRLSTGMKNSRIRLFLFPAKLEVAASMGPILDRSNKSDDWFLNALNGADLLQRGFSDPAAVNGLLGLVENGRSSGNLDPNSNEGEGQALVGEGEGVGLGGGRGKLGNLSNQDVHSVLDSSVVETNSSFGSASSYPAMVNLPPIRVHVDEGVGGGGARVFDQRIGIEQQFAQMGVGVQKQEEGLAMMSSPPANLPAAGVLVGSNAEYMNRIVSDDERSDHGAPVGYRRGPPPQPVMVSNSQAHNKGITEDLPSPASVSSDSSLSNATTRQKPPIYQDPSGQITNRVPANFMDQPGAQVQVQQVPDLGYFLPPQYDQLQQQSQQQQQQSQQQQQQQFIHASSHYVQHHPAGGVPYSYYPAYPSQQPNQQLQMDQRYPVYYVSAAQAHAYNLPVQQPNYTEAANMAASSQPQAPPPNTVYSTARNIPPPNAETPQQAGVYRAVTTAANPQLLQVPPHQQQLMGYSQIHHPSQSMAPPPGPATAAYAYEFADPAHTQVYFTQPPLAPQLAAQYQTMTSAHTVVSPDPSAVETVKPRASQAL